MKKLLLSMTAVAMIIASCQKDKGHAPSEEEVVSGIPTSATFRITTSDNATRAMTRGELPTDGTETPNAPTIQNATILIFSEEGQQLLETKVEITGNAPVTKSVTSGVKRIFTLVNVGKEIQELTALLSEGTSTLNQYYAMMTNPSDNTNAVTGLGAVFAEIAVANDLFMSNGASAESKFLVKPGVTETDSKDPASDNYFDVVVKRGVSKARLQLHSTLTAGDATVIGVAKRSMELSITSMKYGLRNINRSLHLSQQFQSDDTPDNDSEMGTDTDGDGVVDSDVTESPTRAYAPYYYKFTNEGVPSTAAEFAKYYYDAPFDINMGAAEYSYLNGNSNDKPMVGNSTYWGIESTIAKVDKNYVVDEFSKLKGGGTDEKQLYGSQYTITAATTDYENATLTGDDKTIFIMRVEPVQGSMFLSGRARAITYANRTVGYQAIYLYLEVLGFIGTPDNNDNTKNDNIWNATGGVVPVNKQAGGDLYFTDYQQLQATFEGRTSDGGKGTGTYYENTIVQQISNDMYVAIGVYISDVYGIYVAGKNYHRLNIKQKTETGTLNMVRRNYMYEGTITAFGDVGEPTPDDLEKDPGNEVDEQSTYITANIEVQPWRKVEVEDGV